MTESLQPIVLVGGRSRRFGRDKLLEPWRGPAGGERLVDQPRLTLRAVFGVRAGVWAVGDCDPAVAARFDRAIPDEFPGAGPIGGIVTALRAATAARRSGVLALSGDLPRMDADTVRALLAAAARTPGAGCVVARTDRVQPCIAVYRSSAEGVLRAAIAAGTRSLADALRGIERVEVPISDAAARNANAPGDLER